MPRISGFKGSPNSPGLEDILGNEHAEIVSRAVWASRQPGLAAYTERLAARMAAERAAANDGAGGAGRVHDPLTLLGTDPGLEAACLPLDWLIEGLGIAPGKISLVTAYAGGSKTPTAALLSVCVAADKPCLGHPVRRARVLYLAAEGGRIARRKILRIGLGLGVDVRALVAEGWLTILDAEALDEGRATALKEAIRAHGLGLVVVDTVSSALRTAGTSRNDEAYARLLWDLGKISEDTRCTILGLAHDNKSASGSDLRGTSGTASIVEAAQTVIRLSPHESDHRRVRVTCVRAPDERFEEFGVRWVDGDEGRVHAARGALDVSLPLRCVLDESGSPSLDNLATANARAREDAEAATRTAGERIVRHLQGAGWCRLDELVDVSGESKRAVTRALARLRDARVVDLRAGAYALVGQPSTARVAAALADAKGVPAPAATVGKFTGMGK